MLDPDRNWLAWVVLGLGIGLRLALTGVTPANLAYDNHFEPIEKMFASGHLPRPDACWECYQPPLYYLISGGLAHFFEPANRAANAELAPVARRVVQCESTLFGCLTLVVCWAVLRSARRMIFGSATESGASAETDEPAQAASRPDSLGAAGEALGLAIVAFLPQHIYMSAMATNDALTYLLATLAIWAALRAHAQGWPFGWAAVTGIFCGAAVLSKAYGMVTAAVVITVATVAVSAMAVRAAMTGTGQTKAARRAGSADGGRAARAARGGGVGKAGRAAAGPASVAYAPGPRNFRVGTALGWRGVVVLIATTLAVGIWPSVRNLSLYGRPVVDNFDFFRTGMQQQPPGSTEAIEWMTFRFIALLRRPWVHMSQVDSFWTELYGRFWFEYEGIMLSLKSSPEWNARVERVIGEYNWTRPGWRRLLEWGPADTPATLRHVAVASYIAGLPLTALVLGGFVLALRRIGRFAPALLALNFIGCLFVPVYQAARLPYFAAMKSAFALGALSSVPVFVMLAIAALPKRARGAGIVIMGLALLTVLLANVGYIGFQARAGG